jgi:hypothetical protein
MGLKSKKAVEREVISGAIPPTAQDVNLEVAHDTD